MICPRCKRPVSLHVQFDTDQGFRSSSYCEYCKKFIKKTTGPFCKNGHSLDQFKETGMLGCSSCYDAFSPELLHLLEEYRNNAPEDVLLPVPDRLSVARSEELAFLVKRQDALPFQAVPGDLQKKEIDRVLLSIRIRIARNISDLSYKLNKVSAQNLAAVLFSSTSCFLSGAGSYCVADESMLFLWKKRNLVPENAIVASAILPAGPILYTGDEDHLRIAWFLDSMHPDEIEKVIREKEFFDSYYRWQFHPLYGYLAACPSNSGSGVRVSFMLSLPLLTSCGQWANWARELKESGFAIRGEKGEGTRSGPVYQISRKFHRADIRAELAGMYTVMKRIIERENRLQEEMS